MQECKGVYTNFKLFIFNNFHLKVKKTALITEESKFIWSLILLLSTVSGSMRTKLDHETYSVMIFIH